MRALHLVLIGLLSLAPKVSSQAPEPPAPIQEPAPPGPAPASPSVIAPIALLGFTTLNNFFKTYPVFLNESFVDLLNSDNDRFSEAHNFLVFARIYSSYTELKWALWNINRRYEKEDLNFANFIETILEMKDLEVGLVLDVVETYSKIKGSGVEDLRKHSTEFKYLFKFFDRLAGFKNPENIKVVREKLVDILGSFKEGQNNREPDEIDLIRTWMDLTKSEHEILETLINARVKGEKCFESLRKLNLSAKKAVIVQAITSMQQTFQLKTCENVTIKS